MALVCESFHYRCFSSRWQIQTLEAPLRRPQRQLTEWCTQIHTCIGNVCCIFLYFFFLNCNLFSVVFLFYVHFFFFFKIIYFLSGAFELCLLRQLLLFFLRVCSPWRWRPPHSARPVVPQLQFCSRQDLLASVRWASHTVNTKEKQINVSQLLSLRK